jgi:hypothetical protein
LEREGKEYSTGGRKGVEEERGGRAEEVLDVLLKSVDVLADGSLAIYKYFPREVSVTTG